MWKDFLGIGLFAFKDTVNPRGWCMMPVKFLQATTADHRKGQWLIGCTKVFCCVRDTRDASVLTYSFICTYFLIARFAKDIRVTK